MPPKSLEPRLPREDQKQRSRDRTINLILQAIIAANSHHDSTATPQVRLAKAREALFGEKPSRGRKAIQEDLKLFPLLDEALSAEKLKIRQSPTVVQELEDEPSLRGIAKRHSPAFAKPSVKSESTEDWLRRAIKDISITPQDMSDLEGLFYGNSPRAERLQRIFDDLGALGIDCENPIGTKSAVLTPKQD